MAEEKSDGIKSTIAGWVKAAITSVVGLLTGAVLMYVTPLVNSAIKPAKPVANFASQVSGLTVTFNNRSAGGVQGWWDFGDGSALEPFDPKLDFVKHVYAKPATYSVKLSLRNILGEDGERTAPVTTLDGDVTASAPRPEIVAFDLIPITGDQRVPAVYRLLGKVKTATYCILSTGDDRPTEILDDAVNLDRYITFNDMGSYTVRLAAVNGKQLVEKTQTVFVSPNDSSHPTAKLLVSYEAIRVERHSRDMPVFCSWHADADASVSAFQRERPADVGCTIVSAELTDKDDKNGQVRNLSVTIAPDKTKFIVSGELMRETGVLAPKTALPSCLAHVKAVMERRSPPQKVNSGAVMMTVNLNSTAKIPLQPLAEGWEVVKKNVRLELWDGANKVWEGSKAVTAAAVTLKNQTCYVTAIPQTDGFLLKIDGPTPSLAPQVPTIAPPILNPTVGPIRKVGYEYNPLLPKKAK